MESTGCDQVFPVWWRLRDITDTIHTEHSEMGVTALIYQHEINHDFFQFGSELPTWITVVCLTSLVGFDVANRRSAADRQIDRQTNRWPVGRLLPDRLNIQSWRLRVFQPAARLSKLLFVCHCSSSGLTVLFIFQLPAGGATLVSTQICMCVDPDSTL